MSSAPLIQQFQDDLMEVVNKYAGEGLTVGESLGCVELIKLNIWRSSIEDEEL